MKKQVTIVIEKGRYIESIKDGREYTSVGFQTSKYGSASPCDTDEQVNNAIASCKEWIINEGDIPIIENTIEKRQLTQWF
ncbi:MAG: hypothetical protein GY761_20025 [Hyphomicrobiales bacterium]|nr:hypothetical protein [Hyphomicrobiales bacterium]